MSRDRERLLHIQEAIDRVQRYASRGRDAFDRDELIQNWIVRHLQVIGEACRALSGDLQGRYPEVPWSKIVAMRNIIMHDYFEVDQDLVWSTVERDLPALSRNIQDILEDLTSGKER